VDRILLKNVNVAGPHGEIEAGFVSIENGRIADVSQFEVKSGGAEFDLRGMTLYPGFMDIHIHGAAGVDVMDTDLAGLTKMAKFLAQNGVTSWMPTFVPDTDERYAHAMAVIDKFIKWQKEKPVAQIVGVHYEGPFVSDQQCGALHRQYFREFKNGDELSALPRLASDNAKHMMTVAPEVLGGIALIEELCRQDWVVSIGHTKADISTLDAALAAGAGHMTHFFNAMSGLHHRDIGVAGWGLTNPDVSCDVIADGIHVDPKMLALLYKTKTYRQLSLISDSILPAGVGDGEYDVWEEKITVKDGRTSNESGAIAGSVITIADAVGMMRSLGVPSWEAAQMASLNPSLLLNLGGEYGEITRGKTADLVVLDASGKPALTIIKGQIVSGVF
jgi:N-acetylglucosamine-6-phosphate deacetylase